MVHVGLRWARDEERPNKTIMLFGKKISSVKHQTPDVRRVDDAIHCINLYMVDSSVRFSNSYPLDSNLSAGERSVSTLWITGPRMILKETCYHLTSLLCFLSISCLLPAIAYFSELLKQWFLKPAIGSAHPVGSPGFYSWLSQSDPLPCVCSDLRRFLPSGN